MNEMVHLFDIIEKKKHIEKMPGTQGANKKAGTISMPSLKGKVGHEHQNRDAEGCCARAEYVNSGHY